MNTSPLDWLQQSDDRRDKIMTDVENEEKRLGRPLTMLERGAISRKYPYIEQPRGVAVA